MPRCTVTHVTEPKHEDNLKAGALLCPVCCVECVEVEADFEFEGEVLRKIRVQRCPVCQEELFTPEQQEALLKHINSRYFRR